MRKLYEIPQAEFLQMKIVNIITSASDITFGGDDGIYDSEDGGV